MPHGRACPKHHSCLWLCRPAAAVSLCCLHSPNAGVQPFPQPPRHIKGCLKLSQSATRCLFTTSDGNHNDTTVPMAPARGVSLAQPLQAGCAPLSACFFPRQCHRETPGR